jgi:peptide/nickel transport system permease protein
MKSINEIKKIANNYIVRRIVAYIFLMFLTATITFFIFRLMPGNPVEAYLRSMEQRFPQYFETRAGMELSQKYKEMFGLQGSIFHQYFCFLRNIVKGTFGPSLLTFPEPAEKLILQALPWTIGLLGISTIIAWLLGVLVGVFIGWKRESKVSTFTAWLALVVSQMPQYFLAIILVFVFAYTLYLLPGTGAFNPLLKPGFYPEFIFDVIRHATLPALSIILVTAAGWIISSRSLVITILNEDYLIFAEAKGLKPGTILRNYVMKNMLPPQITGLAISLGFIVNGAYVVEWIFNYPGIGRLMAIAVGLRDYSVMQGVMLLSIFGVLTANLIVDLILPLIDPRVRRG